MSAGTGTAASYDQAPVGLVLAAPVGLVLAAPVGLVLAAPASSCGKTTLTLAVLRCLRNQGRRVASVKAGPDYIDPAFHAAASGRPCLNLDIWAMRPQTLARLAWNAALDAELVIAEGVMGLFDGPAIGSGSGSTADLALATGWPLVLIVDVKGQATSAAATVLGFDRFRPGLRLAGVIFNRVGGERHERMLREAVEALGVPVLGCVRRRPELALPDRHLGLVQAAEHPDLEAFLERAAIFAGHEIDLPALCAVARPLRLPSINNLPSIIKKITCLPPLGQRIAIARDVAFSFAYDWLLAAWRALGVETLPFSPLANEGPRDDADAVYLPGGYPELHAGQLAGNRNFHDGLAAAAKAGKPVFGECGGYMVLGQGLTDGNGQRHPMAGLLGVETSLVKRQLHL
ncbi:MAG: cobyrinate a,c-diamide synthase, partial [Rhodospirillaceae bacterium]